MPSPVKRISSLWPRNIFADASVTATGWRSSRRWMRRRPCQPGVAGAHPLRLRKDIVNVASRSVRFLVVASVALATPSCRTSLFDDELGACAAPETRCGEQCVDTTSDGANCGGCGIDCGPGRLCSASACVCGPGLRTCAGACTDTAADPKSCGGCGIACPTGQLCQGGACVDRCTGGAVECNGGCVDLQRNDRHWTSTHSS